MRTGLLPFAVLGAAVISQLQTNPAISQDCNENGIDDAQDILGSSGTFPSAPRYTVSAPPGGISSADFNQDGTVDLAASSNGPQGIWLLKNEGKGTFQKYKSQMPCGPLLEAARSTVPS